MPTTTIATHQKKIEIIEKTINANNIIIFGVKENTYRDTVKKILKIFEDIDVKISKYCITNLTKFGKLWNEEGPLKVTLVSNILKMDILKNRSRLKASGSTIQIKEDLSKETRQSREKLMPFSAKVVEEGLKCFMRGDKLVINGKPWTFQELSEDTAETYLLRNKRPRDNENEDLESEDMQTDDADIVISNFKKI
ncbi:hypothetical protein WDU94_012122 [Cyamophila willieti]